jgi:hypothetical protein
MAVHPNGRIQIPVVRCKNSVWKIASKFRNIQIYVSTGHFVHALNHVELFAASRNSLELSNEPKASCRARIFASFVDPPIRRHAATPTRRYSHCLSPFCSMTEIGLCFRDLAATKTAAVPPKRTIASAVIQRRPKIAVAARPKKSNNE